MRQLKTVDVVVIGGGWTGLAVAKEITTRTSLDVVVLERGPARKLADYSDNMDEVDYAIRMRMMQNIADETITHRWTIKDQAAPARQWGHVRLGTGTGGNGEHWTGVANRYPADTFEIATAVRERFPKSRIPENLAVQDWTFKWAEIEPYYTKVEAMMGIGGKAGNIAGKLIPGGNIFEGPRSKEYPVGPHKQTQGMLYFQKAAQNLGYHPYINPAATLPHDYTNPDGISRPGCAYCGYCMLYGCMISAKAQPTNLLMPILRRKKSFTLRNGSWVRKIVHRDGKAEGVEYMDEKGLEVRQPARIVILSSFTPNNVRLLLLSKIGTPYDSTTGKGTLGKNFCHQMSGGGGGQIVFKEPMHAFMNAGGQGMAFSDFDSFNNIGDDSGILRGGTFVGGGGGGGHAISSFGGVPGGEVKKNWGAEWKKAALKYHDHIGGGGGFSAEHLPYTHNFFDLDPTWTDKWGDPLLRTTIDWTEHEQKARAFSAKIATKLAQEIASVSGGRLVQGGRGSGGFGRASGRYQIAQYATSHLHGGAIMGDNPSNSVVNTHLQHWDLPNLFVHGASAFPHAGATNPTLTALAITYRSADAMINQYLKKPGALL